MAVDHNAAIIEEFRNRQGQLSGNFAGAPLLLLHTTGARSGQPRVHPVMYLDLEGRRFIFASKAGADTNPDWYHNLVAHPMLQLEMGTATYAAIAKPLKGPERDRIYAEQVRRFPRFGEYQEKTTRTIPVAELVRRP